MQVSVEKVIYYIYIYIDHFEFFDCRTSRLFLDTAEAKKTIKIESDKFVKSRYTVEEINKANSEPAKYNMVLTKEPEYLKQSNTGALKKIAKPVGFVTPEPKKATSGNGGGVVCLPGVSGYPKPKKPLVLYDDEANGDCKKVSLFTHFNSMYSICLIYD
jgi:hypothetical protein